LHFRDPEKPSGKSPFRITPFHYRTYKKFRQAVLSCDFKFFSENLKKFFSDFSGGFLSSRMIYDMRADPEYPFAESRMQLYKHRKENNFQKRKIYKERKRR